MSISAVRNFLEKSGCATVVGIVIAIVFIAGIVLTNPGGTGGGGGRSPVTPGEGIASIGDFQVTEGAVRSMADSQLQQYIQQMDEVLPIFEAQAYGNAMQETLNSGLLLEVAKRRNIDTSNEAVKTAFWQMAIDGERSSMVSANLLKFGASEAEFAAAFKKKYAGRTLEESQKEYMGNLSKELENPDSRLNLISRASNDLVMSAIEKQQPVTDEKLKESQNSKVTKRVFLDQTKHPGEDLVKRAEEIKAEIESKKVTFEQAMQKYSDEEAAKGKTKSDNTFIVSGTTLLLDKEFAPIVPLQQDQMAIVKMPTGVSVFKLLYVTPEVPADFEAKKEEYRKQLATMLAANTMQDELKQLRNSNTVQWHSEGYRVVYDWFRLMSDSEMLMDKDARKAQMQELVDRAAKAMEDDPRGSRIAALVHFSVFNQLYDSSTAEEKIALQDKRIEAYNQVLTVTSNVDLRLELVKMLALKKDAAGVHTQIQGAVDGITGVYSANAQRKFGDISKAITDMKAAGMLTADQVTKLQASLTQWKKDKVQQDKAAADDKKKQEAEMKKQQDEAKKAQEAAKAQAEKEAKKTPPPKTTPPPKK